MSEKQKEKIIEKVSELLPTIEKDRLEALLTLILLEIESYNDCGNVIDWQKLSDIIVEVLYQTAKNESEETISSVRRGDTTISYSAKTQIRQSLGDYESLIRKLIGCGSEVLFF